jgi:hypothetical protein
MNNNANAVVSYNEVPVGAVFTVLKDDRIKASPWGEEKIVSNRGTFVKKGSLAAEEIHNGKTAIFALNAPCRVIKKQAA